MTGEQPPSHESGLAEVTALVHGEIDQRKDTNNFYLWLLPDEELGIAGFGYSLDASAEYPVMARRIGEGESIHGSIVEALNEFRESEEGSEQFSDLDLTQGQQFEAAREAAIEWWQMPYGQEKDARRADLEVEVLKPLLKEMTPILLGRGVYPFDATT